MTIGSHQKTIGATQTWITPRWIIEILGPFDLDPCAAWPRPWSCAKRNFVEHQNGLQRPWSGRVWLNPPFHRYQISAWMQRMAQHDHGIALLHARTEAEWFEPVWDHASAILFLANRLYFHHQDGRRARANSGAPVCLVAFGANDARRLKASGIAGYLVDGWDQMHCPHHSSIGAAS